ncbi:energy-coupling factor transporter transmembrane component T family protein [Dongia sedimenti]|uniref:Energy-coupling factor transporter transmembrane component T n=1 Tax=Dongia sedimenti TaxID=3064282 RepID=A0ABU0YIX2_9PROT|nr:energy-coupling factor transporter transmembrane component T [Rhodospirillaceae bacterium R-7]
MLRAIHPLVKLALCLAWIAACLAVFDPRFQIATALIAAAALVLLDRVSPILVLAMTVPFALFGIGFLTTNLAFHEEADFARHIAAHSLFAAPAWSVGITLFLRTIAIGLVSALFAVTTDPGAFVRTLMAYARLSPRVGYALFSVLQIVPELAAEARQIRLAHAMKRGRPPRRLVGPVEAARLLIPLLAFAIRRAGRAAIALEARGLGRAGQRTIVHVPVLGRRDLWFAVVAGGLLSLLLLGTLA